MPRYFPHLFVVAVCVILLGFGVAFLRHVRDRSETRYRVVIQHPAGPVTWEPVARMNYATVGRYIAPDGTQIHIGKETFTETPLKP